MKHEAQVMDNLFLKVKAVTYKLTKADQEHVGTKIPEKQARVLTEHTKYTPLFQDCKRAPKAEMCQTHQPYLLLSRKTAMGKDLCLCPQAELEPSQPPGTALPRSW